MIAASALPKVFLPRSSSRRSNSFSKAQTAWRFTGSFSAARCGGEHSLRR
jgi:hypothetical protein